MFIFFNFQHFFITLPINISAINLFLTLLAAAITIYLFRFAALIRRNLFRMHLKGYIKEIIFQKPKSMTGKKVRKENTMKGNDAEKKQNFYSSRKRLSKNREPPPRHPELM